MFITSVINIGSSIITDDQHQFFLFFFTLSLCIFVVKCTNVLLFLIFSIRPKSCFGGVIEQSGYLVYFRFWKSGSQIGGKSGDECEPFPKWQKISVGFILWSGWINSKRDIGENLEILVTGKRKIEVSKRVDPPAPFMKLFHKVLYF